MSELFSKLQVLVLNKLSTLKKELREWEKSYFARNKNSAPSFEDDNCIYYTKTCKRIRIADQLLVAWRINFS